MNVAPDAAAKSRKDTASSSSSKRSTAGTISTTSTGPIERWESGSNRLSDSTMSPTNSMRTGCSSEAGNTSRMPPRSANEPCSVTGSSRAKPALGEQIRQVVRGNLGARPDLDRRSQHARRRAHARHQRGRRGHHQPRVPGRRHVQRAAPRGAHAEVRAHAPVGIHLPRRVRQHEPLRFRVGGAGERRREEARVGRNLVHVLVGRHHQHGQPALRQRRGRGGERLDRWRQPRGDGRGLGQLQARHRAGDEGSKGERGSVQEHVLGRRRGALESVRSWRTLPRAASGPHGRPAPPPRRGRRCCLRPSRRPSRARRAGAA